MVIDNEILFDDKWSEVLWRLLKKRFISISGGKFCVDIW